jgi:hypothetical protein
MTAIRVASALFVVLCASLSAQSVDGTVDMTAPAPRTAFDGKPDLSGVWQNLSPAGAVAAVTLNEVPYATFADIGAGYRIGLPLHPWAALLKSSRMKDATRNADVVCAAFSVQQYNAHGFPRKIVHAPGMVAIVFDLDRGARQIFTDGRPRRNPGTQAFSYGYSRGAWQGDTLVVLTTNYRDGVWLDMNGSPMTDAGRTIERLRRANVGTLEIEQTIDDPKAYARPFTTRLTWQLVPDTESLAMRCAR